MIIGWRFRLGVSKQVELGDGNIILSSFHQISNDLGFQRRGNKFHQSLQLSNHLLAPNKFFLEEGIDWLQYNRLCPRDFRRFHIEYSFWHDGFWHLGNAETRDNTIT